MVGIAVAMIVLSRAHSSTARLNERMIRARRTPVGRAVAEDEDGSCLVEVSLFGLSWSASLPVSAVCFSVGEDARLHGREGIAAVMVKMKSLTNLDVSAVRDSYT